MTGNYDNDELYASVVFQIAGQVGGLDLLLCINRTSSVGISVNL